MITSKQRLVGNMREVRIALTHEIMRVKFTIDADGRVHYRCTTCGNVDKFNKIGRCGASAWVCINCTNPVVLRVYGVRKTKIA